MDTDKRAGACGGGAVGTRGLLSSPGSREGAAGGRPGSGHTAGKASQGKEESAGALSDLG